MEFKRYETKEKFLEEYEKTYKEKDFVKTLVPMTLEGCVVRISDIIAYLGKDIEDAIMLGKIKKSDIPESISSILGTSNREIINTIILDIIENSLEKPYIKLSDKVYQAIVNLKKFNYQKIYDQSLTLEEKENITKMFQVVFDKLLKDIETKNKDSIIYKSFLNYKSKKYITSFSNARKVLDFIAGMTDDYFIECYKNV